MHAISIHTETPSFLIITDQDTQLNRIGKKLSAPIVWTAASSIHLAHALVICLFAFFVKTYHFFTPKNHSDQIHGFYLDVSIVYAHFAIESFLKSVASIFINFQSSNTRNHAYQRIEKVIENSYHSSFLKKVRRTHIDGESPAAQLNIVEIFKYALIRSKESLESLASACSLYGNKVLEEIHIRH